MQAMRLTRFAPFLAILGLVIVCAAANAQLSIRLYNPSTGVFVTVADGDTHDTNNLTNQLDVDPTWLNRQLGGSRPVTFVSLGASSNASQTGEPFASLKTTAQVNATTVPGVLPIHIQTTQIDWNKPAGNPREFVLGSTALFTDTSTNVPGGQPDNLAFVANANDNNLPFGNYPLNALALDPAPLADGVVPARFPEGYTPPAISFIETLPQDPLTVFAVQRTDPFIGANPYALSTFLRIATGPSPAGGPLRNIQFTTMARVDAVPEPGSLAMLASLGLSGGLFGLKLRRK